MILFNAHVLTGLCQIQTRFVCWSLHTKSPSIPTPLTTKSKHSSHKNKSNKKNIETDNKAQTDSINRHCLSTQSYNKNLFTEKATNKQTYKHPHPQTQTHILPTDKERKEKREERNVKRHGINSSNSSWKFGRD